MYTPSLQQFPWQHHLLQMCFQSFKSFNHFLGSKLFCFSRQRSRLHFCCLHFAFYMLTQDVGVLGHWRGADVSSAQFSAHSCGECQVSTPQIRHNKVTSCQTNLSPRLTPPLLIQFFLQRYNQPTQGAKSSHLWKTVFVAIQETTVRRVR